MSPSTRTLLSGAALVLGATLAKAQVTGTYPPVPLASKGPYVYPSGIVRVLLPWFIEPCIFLLSRVFFERRDMEGVLLSH